MAVPVIFEIAYNSVLFDMITIFLAQQNVILYKWFFTVFLDLNTRKQTCRLNTNA